MRRRVLVTFGLIVACLAFGYWLGHSDTPARAQSTTPVPGRHAEVRAAFPFFVKDTPGQSGWRAAEFKDEGGQQYYKADALAGCAAWSSFGDDRPGLTLYPGAADCAKLEVAAAWRVDFGFFYWFAEPPRPTPPPPAATVTPAPTPAGPATEPAATSTSIPTPTPPASPAPTALPIPTLSPAQLRSFTVYCQDEGLYTVTIWGSRDVVVAVDREWCAPFYAALLEFLRRVGEATPARVMVKP